MSKRSSGQFPRRARDFYPTPAKAVLPLSPHLRGVRTFAEPCAGDGALVRHLESFGLRCTHAGDIATGQDALAVDDYGNIDAIVTNPPWDRALLHRLIAHFQRIAVSWLLLDSDWANTKQATPYLRSCTDILAIGRVIWIPGTDTAGFDNAAWYRFDHRHAAGPIFHPYRSSGTVAALPATTCQHCGRSYRPQRSTGRFCCATCRQRAHRAQHGGSSTAASTLT
jgi:hypothetical protein